MKSNANSLVLALVLAGLATPAGAALDPKMEAQLNARFAAADKNKDGKLTLDEARAGMPRVAMGFSLIDADKKGYVTLAQIKAFAAARMR